MSCTRSSRAGFSLVELLMVVALGVILMGVAIPSIGMGDRVRVNNAAAEVRSALQTARLRAISVNRALQVRFNCPTAGQYRIVEAGFGDTGRCNAGTYPYPPAADAAYLTPPKPRYDGPIKFLDRRITLTTSETGIVLQFFPNGHVEKVVALSDTDPIASEGVGITVSANGYQKTINVNSLGKVVTVQ